MELALVGADAVLVADGDGADVHMLAMDGVGPAMVMVIAAGVDMLDMADTVDMADMVDMDMEEDGVIKYIPIIEN